MKMENKKHYWPDEVRLKMIEKSEFYSEPKIYQFGFYDGYHSLTRELSELREERDKLKLIISGKTFFDEKEVMQKEIDGLREENERLRTSVVVYTVPKLPKERINEIDQLLQSKKP
jgi:hypothetical protein